jgi:hypothetical protein
LEWEGALLEWVGGVLGLVCLGDLLLRPWLARQLAGLLVRAQDFPVAALAVLVPVAQAWLGLEVLGQKEAAAAAPWVTLLPVAVAVALRQVAEVAVVVFPSERGLALQAEVQ